MTAPKDNPGSAGLEVADSLAQRVVDAHLLDPTFGATVIAHMLGCSDAYVRATAKRRSLSLPRSPHGAVPTYGAAYIANRRAALSRAGKSS